jgi:predicted ABC-type ATPase
MIQEKLDFGFETTLSGRSHLALFQHLSKAGYDINVFYLWVPTIDFALARIRGRVLLGGHDVPEEDVRRRFHRSMGNFFQRYKDRADKWMVFDSSASPPLLLASKDRHNLQISHPSTYNQLSERYAK